MLLDLLNYFLILFLAVLGLLCCTGFSLVVVGGRRLSSCSVRVSNCGGFSCGAWALQCAGFSSYSAQAWLLHGMCDLPKSGIEPVSPALAGGVFTTEPPGMPLNPILNKTLH